MTLTRTTTTTSLFVFVFVVAAVVVVVAAAAATAFTTTTSTRTALRPLSSFASSWSSSSLSSTSSPPHSSQFHSWTTTTTTTTTAAVATTPNIIFTTSSSTRTKLMMALMEDDDEEDNFYDDDNTNYEDDDTINYLDDVEEEEEEEESNGDLEKIVLDLEVEEDIVVGDDIDVVETTATITDTTPKEVAFVETETETTTKSNSSSETSWSELLSEAAGAAVLLGGKAAKAAAEKVGELKNKDDLPSFPTDFASNVPKSLKDVASQASNLGEVAAKVASDTIDGITTAVPGSSSTMMFLKRSKKNTADVAIPYDSAARLAYEEWKVEFKNKIPRPFEKDNDEEDDDDEEKPMYTSEERFQFFQERYVNATIQNVALKKQLREAPPPAPAPAASTEDGNVTVVAADVAVPSFIVLDQYADLSPEEYAVVMKSLEPKSWSEILGEIATLAGTAAASTAEIISSTTSKGKPTIKKVARSNVAAAAAAAKNNKPAPSFSIFSSNRKGPKGSTEGTSSTMKKNKVTKTASLVETTKPTSSMFGGILSPKTKTEESKSPKMKKAAVKTPKKYSKASKKNEVSRASLSLFAPKPKKVEPKQPTTTPAPTRSTFSIFGSPKSAPKSVSKKSTAKVAAKKKTGVDAKSSIPTLTNWVQNDDGSLTGKVSNSKNYRNGTKITTSPVRKGVKKGSVVKTGSGSQYKLM